MADWKPATASVRSRGNIGTPLRCRRAQTPLLRIRTSNGPIRIGDRSRENRAQRPLLFRAAKHRMDRRGWIVWTQLESLLGSDSPAKRKPRAIRPRRDDQKAPMALYAEVEQL